jgi:hypothetical protein
MDYIEYLALLGHAEYLDAQGKFAEADKTIRVAQFGGFGNQGGFGNLGGMFGGRGGANPGALGTGALVNQAFTGRNPLQNILGTAAAAAAYEQQRKQQSNSGKDALVQAQDKLRQLEEQLSKEVADSPRKSQLEAEVAKQKIVIQNLQKLPYYQAPAAAPPAGQQQGGQQVGQQSQGAFPATAQLDTRKVFNLVAQATDGPTLSRIIEQNRFTPAEENLAYQIFMYRQQQSAAQAPGQQAGVAQTDQLAPEVKSTIVTLAMDSASNRNTAWQAITSNSNIPPAAKVLALEYYDKLKTDPRYVTQVQTNQSPAETILSHEDKAQADNMLKRVLARDFKGDRYKEVKNQYATQGINKAQYDYIIKEMQSRLGVLAKPTPARPQARPAKPAAKPAPARPAGR